MKGLFKLLFVFLFINAAGQTKISVCSWNIQNFGKSKSDEEIAYIAKVIKDFDAVAIIEVVAGPGGSQAVARLSNELNRTGTKWEYTVSAPTSSVGHGTERYAFIWKSAKLKKVGDAWLEKKYHKEIDREPFFITFQSENKQFTMSAFHAVPTAKHPEYEIPILKSVLDEYPNQNILLCGDFNLSQANFAFDAIKHTGYTPIFVNQKTSLKNKCIGTDCLASEYDNIFYQPQKNHSIKGAVIPFYKSFSTIKEAKLISDHIPVYYQFSLN